MYFVVECIPKGKGRPRFTRSGHAYTPEATRIFEHQVAIRACDAMEGAPIIEKDVPIHVTVHAAFPIPRTWATRYRQAALQGVKHHTHRPDLDNVVKAILDGMQGIVFEDDSQVVKLSATKGYAEAPHVAVWVEEAEV